MASKACVYTPYDQKISSQIPYGGFQKLYENQEPVECLKLRYEKFQAEWNEINEIYQNYLKRHYEDTFQLVNTFFDLTQSQSEVIPTGILCTGINSADCQIFFEKLTSSIQESPNYKIAIIEPQTCVNLKKTLKSLIDQFILGETSIENEQSGEISVPGKKSKITKLSTYDIYTLSLWFKFMKQKYSEMNRCIILVQDFENFDLNVLKDLILILRNSLEDFPVTLLFSVSTSTQTLSSYLDVKTLSKLSIKKFDLQLTQSNFDTLVSEIFISRIHGFKLGPEPFKYLIDDYRLNTLSINSFIKNLKYILMEYYYSNPLSILCDTDDHNSELDQLQNLTKNHLESIRMLPSFRIFVQSLNNLQMMRNLLLNDTILIEQLGNLLKTLKKKNQQYQLVFQILIFLIQTLKHPTISDSSISLYLQGLESNLSQSQIVLTVTKLLPIMLEEDVKLILIECLRIFKENKELFEDEIKQISFLLNEDVQPTKGKQKRPLKKQKSEPQEKSDLTFSIFLNNLFMNHLNCFSNLALHEIYFFLTSKNMKKALNPNIRAIVQATLCNPNSYISGVIGEDAFDEQDEDRKNLPDISIMFQLYLESGKTIYLADFFEAFISQIPKPADGQELNMEELRARFELCLYELESMGFIKTPKQQRSDTVIRLTWDFGQMQ